MLKSIFSGLISGVGITDIVDILLVAIIIYEILLFIRKTRAEQILKGILVLIVATGLSDFLHFYTLHWLLKTVLAFGAIALIIIFQPELRRALEYIGRGSFAQNRFLSVDKDTSKKVVSEIVNAVEYFSQTRTGALIIIEENTALEEIIETGTVLEADITSQLLGNIFYEGAPLHDGAVIIRGDVIMAAGCVLPLTQNKNLSKDLGTRHRAGIGISENSDATVIIVSEETGIISMAKDGKLTRFLDGKTVEKTLLSIYLNPSQDNGVIGGFISKVVRRDEDVQE